MAVPDGHQTVAIGMPGQVRPVVAAVGDLPLAGAVRADQEDLVPAGPLRGEGQRGAVGRPHRVAVVVLGRAGQGPVLTRVEVHHVDGGPVPVGVGREDVRHPGAVGRRVGGPAVPVTGGHRHRPRIVGIDLDEARGAIALDGGEEQPVRRPHRVTTLQDRLRRATVEGHDPDLAVVAVGDPRPVRRHRRADVLPPRRQRPSGGQAAGGAGGGVDGPDIGGVPVPDEDRRTAVRGEGQVPGPLRRGHGLQPPMGRGDHVGPKRHGQPAPLHRAHPGRMRFGHRRASSKPSSTASTRSPSVFRS